jgi:hypothetical protein
MKFLRYTLIAVVLAMGAAILTGVFALVVLLFPPSAQAAQLNEMEITMEIKKIYLGDGAYASTSEQGELIITANHHEQSQATDVVIIDGIGLHKLARFIEDEFTGA